MCLFNSSPSWFSWIILIPYNKEKLTAMAKSIVLLQVILNRKCCRQMFTYTDFTMRFCSMDFVLCYCTNLWIVSRYLHTLDRKQCMLVTGLLTGHCTLWQYLHSTGLSESAMCRKSGKEKKILPLRTTYFDNAQLWLDTEYRSLALYVHECV
jgi:hypothetical protein